MTSVEFKSRNKIDIAGPEDQMGMKKRDWERIKKMILEIPHPSNKIAVVYSIFFGIVISTGVSIIPLTSISNLASWIIPTYVAVTVSAFIIGLILVGVEIYIKKKEKTCTDAIKAEMKEVEKLIAK